MRRRFCWICFLVMLENVAGKLFYGPINGHESNLATTGFDPGYEEIHFTLECPHYYFHIFEHG